MLSRLDALTGSHHTTGAVRVGLIIPPALILWAIVLPKLGRLLGAEMNDSCWSLFNKRWRHGLTRPHQPGFETGRSKYNSCMLPDPRARHFGFNVAIEKQSRAVVFSVAVELCGSIRA
jgi:hypothetical protein